VIGKDADVILASATVLIDPDEDDAPLHAALAAVGVRAVTRPWDDPTVDWGAAKLVVLRSTWNYLHHYERFLAWVDGVSAQTRLLNPAAVVRWNSHKGYLLELAGRGLPVVPTRLVRRGERGSLAELTAEWGEVVVKPAVGAGSYGTMRVRAVERDKGQTFLDAMVMERDMLVQPYFRSVHGHGERAVVWIDGQLTHEVRKTPRFSGDEEDISPGMPVGEPEREVAEAVLAAAPGPLLYARVDLARDQSGRPCLMELELIEPSLFFYKFPPAAPVMAAAIERRLMDSCS
jgi:glutathione synthase/RimK-type ligase-like ATP-grasp enzyme